MDNLPDININKGILFEDNGCFIEWGKLVGSLKKNIINVQSSGDRTIYYWGKHKILSGLELELYSFYWKYKLDSVIKRFTSIEFKAVGDKVSEFYFDLIREHIEGLFGKGVEDIVSDSDKLIKWKIDDVNLSLLLFEQFVFRVSFKISKD